MLPAGQIPAEQEAEEDKHAGGIGIGKAETVADTVIEFHHYVFADAKHKGDKREYDAGREITE